MTPNEFVIWLKGFAQAASNYTLTPAQWDDVREQLDRVNTDEKTKGTRYTLDASNWNTTSTGKISGVTYKQDVLTTNTVF
jgi:hypothetical protein